MKDTLNIQDWRWMLKQLKAWYSPDKRKLPWKDLDDAYLVWVSEVFLQQTQADRVIEYWLRFTAKFPTVEDLAAASFEEALPYFKGLGFYGRLRRMLLTAKAVCENPNYQNPMSKKYQFPRTVEELEQLPGIGPYTARAVASFAYGDRVLAPDTNVSRILARMFGGGLEAMKEYESSKGQVPRAKGADFQRKWVMNNLEFFDQSYPKDFSLNQVLMDFGSSVCTARKPSCETCPLIKTCEYGRDPSQFEKVSSKFQVTSSMREQRSLRSYQKIVVGILIQDKQVLVSRRKADQTYSGLLEFPGGKVEEGEDLRAAMQREFREEVGVEVSVRPPFEKMALHRQKLLLHFHRCRILQIHSSKFQGASDNERKQFVGAEGQDLMWIHQDDLDPKQFLPANKAIIEALKKSRF